MSDTNAKVVPLKKTRVTIRRQPEGFQFKSSTTKQRYPIQLNADFGTEPGPWLAVNFQGRVYALGWLPRRKSFT